MFREALSASVTDRWHPFSFICLHSSEYFSFLTLLTALTYLTRIFISIGETFKIVNVIFSQSYPFSSSRRSAVNVSSLYCLASVYYQGLFKFILLAEFQHRVTSLNSIVTTSMEDIRQFWLHGTLHSRHLKCTSRKGIL